MAVIRHHAIITVSDSRDSVDAIVTIRGRDNRLVAPLHVTVMDQSLRIRVSDRVRAGVVSRGVYQMTVRDGDTAKTERGRWVWTPR